MRRGLGFVLIGLGTFLLALAPLAKWYAVPRLAVAPLGCEGQTLCENGVSISPSTGVATTLFDPATLSPRSNVDLTATRRVKPDRPASKGANDRTVYESFQEVVDGDDKLVTASSERIAFDGQTSRMLSCCDANLNGEPIEDYSGIAPYKFGFFVKKQTYQYFDGTLGKSSPMEFKGTDTVKGLSVYRFEQVIEPTQYAELEVPGELVGAPELPTFKSPRFYANTRTVWVEPTTGAVVRGQEVQKQTLRGPDGTDQLTLLDATLAFTDENVTQAVKTAKDGSSQLKLLNSTVPLVGLIGGLLLLVVGAFLTLAGRRDEMGSHAG